MKLIESDASPDEILKAMIAKIKQYTDLSDEEAEELANELLGRAKEVISSDVHKRPSYTPKRLSFASDRKDFRDAMLRDMGNVFHGCPMSNEKRKLMESQLAEQYAKDLGISPEADEKKDLDNIKTNVDNWIKKLPITINNQQEQNMFDDNKRDFISKIQKLLPTGDFEKINEETKKYMQRIPLDPKMKEDDELLSKKAEELIDTLVPTKAKDHKYGMSFKGLTDFINTWLDNIHIQDETKSEDEIKDIKKDMAYNLVHKIGEMNVDPEIFNDNNLYEDLWRDELQNLLGDVTITDDNIRDLKEDLIEKIKDAQHRAHDEIAGQTYKQNLRDTISNILPDPRTLSKDEQAILEVLKDQLADAFIDLHYSGSNENLRANLKRKISNEINTFCKDYLNRHPDSPLNSQKLNYDLYTALNNVPLPIGDSIRYEVEQARIREEINDWVRELPLEPQSPAELLARNKFIYILAKKLFDIEVEVDDPKDVPLMRKEIINFLNKMPLKPGENNNLLANKLIDKLKNSELSRKYSASSNVTIDAFGNASGRGGGGSGIEGSICPYYKSILDKQTTPVCGQPVRQPESLPPCTLSPEDTAHLERIRRRSCLSPRCITSLLKKDKRNAGVGPRLVDAGSQSELRPEVFKIDKPQESPICPAANEKTPRPCPGVPVTSPAIPVRSPAIPVRSPAIPVRSPGIPVSSPCHSDHQLRRTTISSSNIQTTDCRGEVQPHIIIKQYYWDPEDKSKFQESDLKQRRPSPPTCHEVGTSPCIQSGSTPHHQTGRSSYQSSSPEPYHQIGTSPYPESGRMPCHQTGTAQTQQSSSAPCHRHNFSSYLEEPLQNSSSQRVPCDHAFTSQRQPSPDRYPQWSPEQSFQVPQDRSSHRSIPCSRSPCTPSPCMSPLSSPFGPNQQSTPLSSPGYSFRRNDSRYPKRDGLQDQIPCSSSRPSRKERVIELGSLDDLCNPRPKKRNSNDFDWSYAKFPEEDSFWGAPCMRRVILDDGIDEPLLMEREHKEERVRCKCKEKLVPKCGRTQSRTSHRQPFSHCNQDRPNLNRCSKCCGLHCPYPSNLYFRQ